METKYIVYHLKIEAYSKRFGRLKEKYPFYSEVFFSHEKALETGKEHLADIIQALYDASDYGPHGLSLQNFMGDGQMYFRWTITEIDLELLHKDGYPKNSEFHLASSAHIECEYDFDGELIGRSYWWYCDGISGSGSEIEKRIGDDLPEAGQKFKVGDFVHLKRPRKYFDNSFDTDDIFVVVSVPIWNAELLEEKKTYFENTYYIETVGKQGEYIWHLHFHNCSGGIHEDELVKYEGKVAEDSPLMFLRRVFLGEFDDMFTEASEYGGKGIVCKLEKGEILLTQKLSWREVPELADLGEEEV